MDLLKIMQKMSVYFSPEKGHIVYFFEDEKWWAVVFFKEPQVISEAREFLMKFKSKFPLEFAPFNHPSQKNYKHLDRFKKVVSVMMEITEME